MTEYKTIRTQNKLNKMLKDTEKNILENNDKDFRETDFYDVSFSKSFTESCDFSQSFFFNVKFSNTIFKNCNFAECDFVDVKIVGDVMFINCNFQKCSVVLNELEKATFHNCDLSDVRSFSDYDNEEDNRVSFDTKTQLIN